jgi:HEAT repeat protein
MNRWEWGWAVRASAAQYLGQLNDTRAVEPFESALNDESEYVRSAAEEALTKLGWQAPAP